mmetsp:Transcript_10601/g.18078  ORF Transcript_10601/g.18078 Transcript_10601/m.18078 type:complete len:114 (-) Transcript_10601:2774-3115(-)
MKSLSKQKVAEKFESNRRGHLYPLGMLANTTPKISIIAETRCDSEEASLLHAKVDNDVLVSAKASALLGLRHCVARGTEDQASSTPRPDEILESVAPTQMWSSGVVCYPAGML